jgi:hypothetical protein
MGNRRQIAALISMPAGIRKTDIDMSQLLEFYPGNVMARRQFAFELNRSNGVITYVLGLFDKASCLRHLQNDRNNIEVVGKMTSGQYFYGSSVIRVLSTTTFQRSRRRDF